MIIHTKLMVVMALFVSICIVCLAADDQTEAKKQEVRQIMHVKANNMTLSAKAGESTLSGDVVITMVDVFTLKAKKIVIKHDGNQDNIDTVRQATDVQTESKKREIRQTMHIKAKAGVFGSIGKELTLSGDVVITMVDNFTLKAEKAVIKNDGCKEIIVADKSVLIMSPDQKN